jgi:hypothetical protein
VDREGLMLLTALVIWSAFVLLQLRVAAPAEHRAIIGGMFSGRERRVLQWLGLA